MPDYLGPRRPYDPWGRPLPGGHYPNQRPRSPQGVPVQPEGQRAAGEPSPRGRAADSDGPLAAARQRLTEYEAALAAERRRGAEQESALAAERKRASELEAKLAEQRRQVAALEAELAGARERAAQSEATLAAEQEQAADARAKADSYLDLAQRTQADFVNYKRRAERERADEGQAARGELLVQLLPVLDDLERALDQVPEELKEHAWAEGMPLIARRLRLALAKAGVERVGNPGEEFDPRLHEALAYEPKSGFAEGQIATVVRPGYRLGERVIRPAQVTVAQGE